MRLAVSEKFIAAALSAGRTVERKFYIKKTNDRSELLSTGTWIDVSDFVSGKDFSGANSSVETDLGTFSAGRISITGNNISWWNANIFNYANQLEVKVEYILNGLIADTIPIFSGWIEKQATGFKTVKNVSTNTVQFTVWSYADYADDVSTLNVLAQYIEDDIDGAGTDGLVLPHIKDLFVASANVASFVLQKGVHTISYQIDGSSNKQAKLDDGAWVTLTSGYFTLANAAVDQKVTVYARATIPTNGTFTDDIIVNVQGDTLPKNWYSNISARFFLKKCFEKIGVTTQTYDAFEYDTYGGQKKISFLDVAPNDISKTKNKNAMVSDGTYLWFGIGNELYRRTMTDDSYTLMHTFGSGENILRLIYSPSVSMLWIYTSAGYLYRLSGGGTLSSPVNISTNVFFATIQNHQMSGRIVYNNYATGQVHEINPYSLVDTTIGTGASITDGGAFVSGAEYWLSTGNGFRKWYNDGNGWEDNGTVFSSRYYSSFAYHSAESRIYFTINPIIWNTYGIYSHSLSSDDTVTVVDGGILLDYNIRLHYSATEGAIFVTDNAHKLYRIAGNVANVIYSPLSIEYYTVSDYGGRVYGVDTMGRLFQYANKVALYIDSANFNGSSCRAAIEKICNSFNLMYSISSVKKVRVQRRADSAGNLITTGNSVSLNGDSAKDITEDSAYGVTYNIVSVDNSRKKVSFDGTNFGAVAFGDEKVITISSDLIPDEIIEDICYNAFKYFNTPHKLYDVPSPVMNWQYESLDGATLNYSGTLSVNASGLIVGDSIDQLGKMQFKILVNA